MQNTKKKFFGISLLIFLSYATNKSNNSAITYRFDGSGRFGDCIMIYCKAKKCAMDKNLPLFCKPFRHSELLALQTKEQLFTNSILQQLPNQVIISSADEIDPNRNNTLFITDLYTMLQGKQPTNPTIEVIPIPEWMNFWPDEIYALMQTDTLYKQQVHAMLQPNGNTPSLATPIGTISVAIHIRKGGSVDLPHYSPQLFDKNHPEQYQPAFAHPKASDKKFPLRFPPEQYYIDMLNQLAALLDPLQLSVSLYSDDHNSQALLEHFKQHCTAPNVHIAGIYFSAHFIDDLARMAQADCLIRPCSHFSGTAQLMGNHKIIMRPRKHGWAEPLLLITASTLFTKENNAVEAITFYETMPAQLKQKLQNLFYYLVPREELLTDGFAIGYQIGEYDQLSSEYTTQTATPHKPWNDDEKTIVLSLLELLSRNAAKNEIEKLIPSLENEPQEQKRES